MFVLYNWNKIYKIYNYIKEEEVYYKTRALSTKKM